VVAVTFPELTEQKKIEEEEEILQDCGIGGRLGFLRSRSSLAWGGDKRRREWLAGWSGDVDREHASCVLFARKTRQKTVVVVGPREEGRKKFGLEFD
jgi:hypothetical protein